LPVYNGEKYLEATLLSLLKQTLQDYSLIISDNASTDRTEEICRTYASSDHRISYSRTERNIGAVPNWYRVFRLSSSDYFASVAHDDLYHPEYMHKCIEVMERDPSIVLCYSKTTLIDELGRPSGNLDVTVDTTSSKPHVRLYNVIANDYLCIQLYGAMRSSALRSTKMFAGYYGCDRNTLAELALLGPLYELPEYLFFHRVYPDALGAAMGSGRSVEQLASLDPGTDWGYRATAFTIYGNYFLSVARLLASRADQWRCYRKLMNLILQKTPNTVARMWQERMLW
jgi:glycosyltransferase involved in cell wall biosynthesis